ncbi:MAG: TetR/AcrR family transcriptional regulator [Hyphomicrobiales bacterium]|nr:TetR/AcrR family transcriptional regulator [Hyphomicrobiales bacterium]MDE2114447.1 TetR/AcrR family transcriptional regulator [Hyphomicrobiales bacterium]
MKSSPPPQQPYHHGDARNALLRAASEILETSGAAGLALRQLAERAGLSRQAPYNHFADKQALLAELVKQGFERLGADMKAAADSDLPPVARLTKAGASYIAFAQQTPALFRLMFSKELVDVACYPKASGAAEHSFAQLCKIVAALTSPETVADMSLVAWSLVHGYATLCIETGLEGPEHRADRAALFTRAVLGSVQP